MLKQLILSVIIFLFTSPVKLTDQRAVARSEAITERATRADPINESIGGILNVFETKYNISGVVLSRAKRQEGVIGTKNCPVGKRKLLPGGPCIDIPSWKKNNNKRKNWKKVNKDKTTTMKRIDADETKIPSKKKQADVKNSSYINDNKYPDRNEEEEYKERNDTGNFVSKKGSILHINNSIYMFCLLLIYLFFYIDRF